MTAVVNLLTTAVIDEARSLQRLVTGRDLYAVWAEYRYIATWRGLTPARQAVWEEIAGLAVEMVGEAA